MPSLILFLNGPFFLNLCMGSFGSVSLFFFSSLMMKIE